MIINSVTVVGLLKTVGLKSKLVIT